MKTRSILHLNVFVSALSALSAAAAEPVEWRAKPGDAPAMFARHHGSTLEFRCEFKGYGEAFAPGAEVMLWYQTNGMGRAWWSVPAARSNDVLTATWPAAADPGADRVSFFFGAPSNAYASAVVRLLASPGFTPNVLSPPVRRLDFASVSVTNAPYYTKGEVETKIAELAPVPGDYENVSNRAMRISLPGDEGHPGGVFSPYINGLAKSATDARNLTKPGQSLDPGKLTLNQREQEVGDGSVTGVWWPAFLDAFGNWHWVASEDYVDAAADLSGYATTNEVGALQDDMAELRAENAIVYRLYQGSNVVAEVTNYNSAVHAPELRLMQLNESNEYFTVWAETNGLTRTLNAAKQYTDGATGEVVKAVAPRAWGKVTSGMGVDAPAGTTWLSTARTVIAGGLEYEKHVTSGGAIWLLESNGMSVDFHPQTNNVAFLDLSNADGTPIFRVEKTDAYLVGVHIDDVTVDGNALVCHVPVVASEHPYVRVRASLESGEWSKEEDGIPSSLATVTWSGSVGDWTCRIQNNTGGNGFFAQMEYMQEGGTKIVNSAPLDVSNGILCTDGIHKARPVYNNGTITWETVP